MTPAHVDGQAGRQRVDAGDQIGERVGVEVGAGDGEGRRAGQHVAFVVRLVPGLLTGRTGGSARGRSTVADMIVPGGVRPLASGTVTKTGMPLMSVFGFSSGAGIITMIWFCETLVGVSTVPPKLTIAPA